MCHHDRHMARCLGIDDNNIPHGYIILGIGSTEERSEFAKREQIEFYEEIISRLREEIIELDERIEPFSKEMEKVLFEEKDIHTAASPRRYYEVKKIRDDLIKRQSWRIGVLANLHKELFNLKEDE